MPDPSDAIRRAFGDGTAADAQGWLLQRSAAAVRATPDGGRLRVWTVVAAGVPAGAPLPVPRGSADLVRTAAGEVVASVTLPVDGLTAAALDAARAEVDRLAADQGPALAQRWGATPGSELPGGLDWVWRQWAEAILSVEVAPGRWVEVTGPGAGALPLPGPLHLLTAWDPGGTPATPEANEASTCRLLDEVRRPGLRVLPSAGRDRAGTYADRGVAVHGLTGEEARALGARFGQEAVYELTDGSIAILACASARVVTVPRRQGGR